MKENVSGCFFLNTVYLNLSIHFQSEQIIKLRFWLKHNLADI